MSNKVKHGYTYIFFVVAAKSVTMAQRFPPNTSPVSPGSHVSIVCETDSANPTADITWKRNSVEIEANDTFTITAVERIGEYSAMRRVSTLSFIAAREHGGREFDCIVPNSNLPLLSKGSTLILKSKFILQPNQFDT